MMTENHVYDFKSLNFVNKRLKVMIALYWANQAGDNSIM